MNLKVFTRRVYITGVLIAGIACFFIFRLVALHFSDRIILSPPDQRPVRRGEIRDCKGYVLAISVERESLFANPERIDDPAGAAAKLSALLGIDRNDLAGLLGRKKRFVWIKRRMDPGQARAVRALGIRGLSFRKEFQRQYPHGDLASNVTGFAGIDGRGLEGIEYKFDDILRGKKWGGANADYDVIRGHHVRLTIDRFIQRVARREIRESVISTGARRGVAVVYEIRTGRLLAMAVYPGFDPNRYWEFDGETRRNFTMVGAFEPGSTLKMMAAACLMESVPGILNNTYTCKGKIDIVEQTINCTDTHGEVDLKKIIMHSCNVGIIEAMKKVRKENLHDILHRFGFGNVTGIEMPGEASGILREVRQWSGLSKYSISLGQEIGVTSIQMVAAFGAIANRGVYMVPTVIDSIESDRGRVVQGFYPRTRGRVLDERIAGNLLLMMKAVVDGGTGKNARVGYYQVAGKTGTAQKSMQKGGYYPDKYYTSFIGIAPFGDPDICVLVVLDEPVKGTSGSVVAAPVFSRIVGRVLPYRGIKDERQPAREPLQARRPPMEVPYRLMPDLRGDTLAEALEKLTLIQQKVPIRYSVSGTGRVFQQKPEPGADISRRRQINLYLRER